MVYVQGLLYVLIYKWRRCPKKNRSLILRARLHRSPRRRVFARGCCTGVLLGYCECPDDAAPALFASENENRAQDATTPRSRSTLARTWSTRSSLKPRERNSNALREPWGALLDAPRRPLVPFVRQRPRESPRIRIKPHASQPQREAVSQHHERSRDAPSGAPAAVAGSGWPASGL